MDNKQKVVIAVLVAVVILFVVALAVQSGSDEGDASTTSSDRGGLFDLLGDDPAAVPAVELAGNCNRSGVTITVQGSCQLEVRPSDERMRLVRLRTNDDIDISAPAPQDADLEIEKELEAGKDVAIAVDSEGARIDLGCGFGQTCTLVVLGSDS